MEEIKGYIRSDGRIGLRNNVICIATVMCATAVVEGISREVPEIIPVIHTDGCETRRIRTLYFTKTLENICRHPNNYAVLLIGLGCERDNAKEIAERLRQEGIRVWARIIQEDGVCQKVIDEGVAQAKQYLAEAAAEERVPVPPEKLVVGIETAEHIKAEDALSGKGCSAGAASAASATADAVAEWLRTSGVTVILPSVYGKKSETRAGIPIQTMHYADKVEPDGAYHAIDQDGERWKGPKDGVFNMDIPESLLSMFASGAQMLVLSTGNSLPLGFPPAPLVKACAEKDALMEADVFGSTTEALEKLKECICSTACGAATYEESHKDVGDRVCTYRRTNIY